MLKDVHHKRTVACEEVRARTEETSKNEGAALERSEKQGAVERNHYTLTPTTCTAHHLTECNLHCARRGKKCLE